MVAIEQKTSDVPKFSIKYNLHNHSIKKISSQKKESRISPWLSIQPHLSYLKQSLINNRDGSNDGDDLHIRLLHNNLKLLILWRLLKVQMLQISFSWL
ncbi:hypothetical protein SAMN05216524_106256 [Mucilaginibacter sp. OK098]|nr:hypothetical protein SAMN05216524_106256 [Mucilaginibacter sp. OK098]